MKLKIGTYNLHQYYEYNRLNTLVEIAEKIAELDLDLIGLQEVAEFEFDFSTEKATNTARLLQHILKTKFNKQYYLSVNMFKFGFKHNHEGLAILSKYKFGSEHNVLVSNTTDYNNYHKRELQINQITIGEHSFNFINGHYTWDNEVELFVDQYAKLRDAVAEQKCILVGDFNNNYQSDNYKLITENYNDVCSIQNIEQDTFSYKGDNRRIDYVFTNLEYQLISHQIHFKDPMLSDHYFVTVEIEI